MALLIFALTTCRVAAHADDLDAVALAERLASSDRGERTAARDGGPIGPPELGTPNEIEVEPLRHRARSSS